MLVKYSITKIKQFKFFHVIFETPSVQWFKYKRSKRLILMETKWLIYSKHMLMVG